MAEEKLDCRGLACPGPVLKTREIVERGDVTRLSVLVDNSAARENVSRFLGRMGYVVRSSGQEGSFEVAASKGEAPGSCEVLEEAPSHGKEGKTAVLVGTDRMGTGDEVLGGRLLFNFIGTLQEMGRELWHLIFLNGGVKLTVEGSESLPALQDLEKNGVRILVCGTCLNHFGLLDKKRVGETTNMLDIVSALQLADKVISLT